MPHSYERIKALEDALRPEVIGMYNASVPNIHWEEMSEERRATIVANYRALKAK